MMEESARKPKAEAPQPEKPSIAKPEASKSASKSASKFANFEADEQIGESRVRRQLTPLKITQLHRTEDWVRVHESAEYWSRAYCLVGVPVPGMKEKILHMVTLSLAKQAPFVAIQQRRFALAAMRNDVFFLAEVPVAHLDNEWNRTALNALVAAQRTWIKVRSLKAEGKEGYAYTLTDGERLGEGCPYADPNWPPESLEDILDITFGDRLITSPDHPAWRDLVGRAQKLG